MRHGAQPWSFSTCTPSSCQRYFSWAGYKPTYLFSFLSKFPLLKIILYSKVFFLWIFSSQQQVDKGAIRFVLSGANIMCPGLTHPNAKWAKMWLTLNNLAKWRKNWLTRTDNFCKGWLLSRPGQLWASLLREKHTHWRWVNFFENWQIGNLWWVSGGTSLQSQYCFGTLIRLSEVDLDSIGSENCLDWQWLVFLKT